MTLDQLSEYHRAKVMMKAREWRIKNHATVLKLIKDCHESAPPAGSAIFDPAKWDGCNWLWFQAKLLKVLTRGTRPAEKDLHGTSSPGLSSSGSNISRAHQAGRQEGFKP